VRTVIILGQKDTGGTGDAREEAWLEGADQWAAAGQPMTSPPALTEAHTEEAWTYLEAGDSQRALRAFAAQVQAAGSATTSHRMGFALAAAISGDKTTAAHAMRCAFEADPAGAAAFPMSDALRAQLEPCAERIDAWVKASPENLNARFLYAVASHWLARDEQARACLAESVTRGDASDSTAALLRIVQPLSLDTAQASL
jgi:hypothetical protein